MNLDPSEKNSHHLSSRVRKEGHQLHSLFRSPPLSLLSHHWNYPGLWVVPSTNQAHSWLRTFALQVPFPNSLSSNIQVVHSHVAFRSWLKRSSEWHSLPTRYQLYFPPSHNVLLPSHSGLLFLITMWFVSVCTISLFLRQLYLESSLIILFMTRT